MEADKSVSLDYNTMYGSGATPCQETMGLISIPNNNTREHLSNEFEADNPDVSRYDFKSNKCSTLSKVKGLVRKKVFSCTECAVTFKRRFNLQRHIDFVHNKEKKGLQELNCSSCVVT